MAERKDMAEAATMTKRNDPLVRKAEEFYDLPLRYEPGRGWVDRNGDPVKTHKWSEIRRGAPPLLPRTDHGGR